MATQKARWTAFVEGMGSIWDAFGMIAEAEAEEETLRQLKWYRQGVSDRMRSEIEKESERRRNEPRQEEAAAE